MIDTLEQIKSVRSLALNDSRWAENKLLNCNQCGEPTPTNAGAAYTLNMDTVGCTCPKCLHAYTCLCLLIEQRKAARLIEIIDNSDDKKREDKIAELQKQVNSVNEYGRLASENFNSRYGMDWRTQLDKVMPNFEMHLKCAQGKPNIQSVIFDATRRGFCRKVY